MRKLLAAYYSISGSCRVIGRGNETTAVPCSELLNFVLKNYLLYSAFCTLINVFLLLKGKTTVTPSTGSLFLKPLQMKRKQRGGYLEGVEWRGLLKEKEQMPHNILG